MMVGGSRPSRARQRTLCSCSRPQQVVSAAIGNVEIPARGVRDGKVNDEPMAIWPANACPGGMHMRGTAQDSTIYFPPQPLNLLAAHLFAHVAKLDEGHAGAPDLEDWGWLRVRDEDLAELGVVTLTTARAPTLKAGHRLLSAARVR